MHSCSWYLALVILVAKEGASSVLDLGHGYQNHTTTCWNPNERFEIFNEERESSPRGWRATQQFSTSEHCGTHLDAPFHFNRDGWKLEDIPLERMIVEGNN